jgi:FixJ family two-component response regulator
MSHAGERDNHTPKPRLRARPRAAQAVAPAHPRSPTASALLIARAPGPALLLAPILARLGVALATADSTEQARPALRNADLVIADAAVPGALDLLARIAEEDPAAVTLFTAPRATLDLAVAAMQAGCVDLIATGADDEAAQASVALALRKLDAARRREHRVDRLRAVCRRLNDARHEITAQVSGMCNDLVDAYKELSDQIDQLALGSEFNGVVRQELDVESLLRVALEFILAKLGPTNAAVYLPSTSCDYTLGAYVNCDLDPAALETTLDDLADAVAPRFEQRPGVHVCHTRRDTAELLGDSILLRDQTLILFPCHHQDECLAIVALFRPDRTPFDPAAREILTTIAGLFAAQLARVIRVHHRHLPKHQWGAPGDEPGDFDGPDDIDLAA